MKVLATVFLLLCLTSCGEDEAQKKINQYDRELGEKLSDKDKELIRQEVSEKEKLKDPQYAQKIKEEAFNETFDSTVKFFTKHISTEFNEFYTNWTASILSGNKKLLGKYDYEEKHFKGAIESLQEMNYERTQSLSKSFLKIKGEYPELFKSRAKDFETLKSQYEDSLKSLKSKLDKALVPLRKDLAKRVAEKFTTELKKIKDKFDQDVKNGFKDAIPAKAIGLINKNPGPGNMNYKTGGIFFIKEKHLHENFKYLKEQRYREFTFIEKKYPEHFKNAQEQIDKLKKSYVEDFVAQVSLFNKRFKEEKLWYQK